jgi:hypothetical protein
MFTSRLRSRFSQGAAKYTTNAADYLSCVLSGMWPSLRLRHPQRVMTWDRTVSETDDDPRNVYGAVLYHFVFPMALRPNAGHGLLILEVSRSHNDTPQSVGLLWTSDQLAAETST